MWKRYSLTPYLLICLALGIIGYLKFFKKTNVPSSYYQAGCLILEKNGAVLKNFPGHLCLFLENGDLIVSNPTEKMRYYQSNGNMLWEDDNPGLHQLILANDKKHFITIVSESNLLNGKTLRTDVFTMRDFQNKTVKEWSTFQNLDLLKRYGLTYFSSCKNEPCAMPVYWLGAKGTKYDGQLTHTNMIQEFTKNEAIPSSNIWKKGNFLVYLFGRLTVALVLDSEMKQVLWHFDFTKIGRDNLHSLQLTPKGTLLAFFNYTLPYAQEPLFSSIGLLDLNTLQTKWSYSGNPPRKYFVENQGGVQLLKNGNYFYTVSNPDNLSGHEVTTSGKEIFSIAVDVNKFHRFQEIKQIDAAEFLKNNRM